MHAEVNPLIPVFREQWGLCLSPVPFYVEVVVTELLGDGERPSPRITVSGPERRSTKWASG